MSYDSHDSAEISISEAAAVDRPRQGPSTVTISLIAVGTLLFIAVLLVIAIVTLVSQSATNTTIELNTSRSQGQSTGFPDGRSGTGQIGNDAEAQVPWPLQGTNIPYGFPPRPLPSKSSTNKPASSKATPKSKTATSTPPRAAGVETCTGYITKMTDDSVTLENGETYSTDQDTQFSGQGAKPSITQGTRVEIDYVPEGNKAVAIREKTL